MKAIKIIFDNELQNDLLNGAKIVWYRKGRFIAHILVRLPKGKFVKSVTSNDLNLEYEYKELELTGAIMQ